MEIDRIVCAFVIIFFNISRRLTKAEDSDEEPRQEQQGNYAFQSVELSFWIALGLAFSVIMTCLCCIFCLKRKTLMSNQFTSNNREQTTEEGRGNAAFDYSDPPPPYSDALKYALSKENEGLPEYSEAYL